MPSLKDLKNRIGSVKSTQKITSAMKMVAAAKLRKAQEQAIASRPYSENMQKIVTNLSKKISSNAPYLITGNPNKNKIQLLVVFSADRGLCGGFNSSITRLVKSEITSANKNGFQTKLLLVGRKAADALRRDFGDKFLEVITGKSANPKFSDSNLISKKILDYFFDEQFGTCKIIFNKFISAITQEVTIQSIIPISVDDKDNSLSETNYVYEYEPNEEEILEDILIRNITTQLFGAQIESTASELAARMTAMDNATRNAGDLIDRLTLQYNRTRQAFITKELIEIISGAEAL